MSKNQKQPTVAISNTNHIDNVSSITNIDNGKSNHSNHGIEVKVDTLGFALSNEHFNIPVILRNLEKLADMCGTGKFSRVKKLGGPKVHPYQKTLAFYFIRNNQKKVFRKDGTPYLFISYEPKFDNVASIRIEFTLTKFEDKELSLMLKFLKKLTRDDYGKIYSHAKLTKIDVALDMYGYLPDQLLIMLKGNRGTHDSIERINGRLVNRHLHKETSNIYLDVYLKTINDEEFTRLEFRRRFRRDAYTMETAHTLPNPFAKTSVYDAMLLDTSLFDPGFLCCIKEYGLSETIKLYREWDSDIALKYNTFLEEHTDNLVDDDLVWESYKKAFEILDIYK